MPFFGDQFFWGQRVQELGVGLPPIRRTQLTGESLAAALKDLACNGELRTAASALGAQIRSETGVENAVRLIEESVG
jgi:UDP:flavonoid glycosyltransferase YjiC (YdhE family)